MLKGIMFERLCGVKVAVRMRVEVVVDCARVKTLRRTASPPRNTMMSFKRWHMLCFLAITAQY